MQSSSFALERDGAKIFVRRWLPDGAPRGAVQIAHGLAEHSARYERLASALAGAGYAVYASDHRGHGPACLPADLGFFAAEDGWRKCLDDLWAANRRIAADLPGLPLIFIGHSLGSIMGQQFIAEHGQALAGAALSGTSGTPPAILPLGRLLARFERWRLGPRGHSAILLQNAVRRISTNRSSRRAPGSTGCRAIRPKSTNISPIRSAASPSPRSSPSISSTRSARSLRRIPSSASPNLCRSIFSVGRAIPSAANCKASSTPIATPG